MYCREFIHSRELLLFPKTSSLWELRNTLYKHIPLLLSEGQVYQTEMALHRFVKWWNRQNPLVEPISMQFHKVKDPAEGFAFYIYRKGCKRVKKNYHICIYFLKTSRHFNDELFDLLTGDALPF